MTNPMGHQTLIAVDPVAPVDTSSEPYEVESESMGKKTEIVSTEGLRGTRSMSIERTREAKNDVGGQITLFPSPLDLDLWLPRILGGAESTDVFALTETLPTFVMCVDKVTDAFLYTGCYVSKAVFSASSGGMLKLVLDILALSETTGQTFPAVTLGVTAAHDPFVMSDGVLTLAGSGTAFRSFELSIDNQLEADFMNSLNATCIDSNGRVITLKTDIAFDSTNQSALYEQAAAGIAGSLAFTNGAVSTSFAFGTLQVADKAPAVGGKTKIPFTPEFNVLKTGTTNEIIVTNDSAI